MHLVFLRAFPGLFCALGLICAGCGGPSRPPVQPAMGQVFQKSTPVAGAFIVFHPASAEFQKAMEARPFAWVQPDGSFMLTTYEEGDGAPEGEYGVTVVWNPPAKSAGPRIRDGGAALPDKLEGRYGNPQKPRLKATVAKGQNTFRFDLD